MPTESLGKVLADATEDGMDRRRAQIRDAQALHRRRAKKKAGRPVRLHPGLIEDICAVIRAGNYQQTAAAACGVPVSTYQNWKARGLEARAIIEATGKLPEDKQGERVFLEFLEALEEARSEAESMAATMLQQVAFGGTVATIEEEWATDEATGEREVIGRTITYAKPDTQALKFLLERGYQNTWRQRVEHSGPEGGPIPVEVEISARDIIRKKLDQVAQRVDPTDETD